MNAANKPLNLPRDEMAFRKIYESQILAGKLTTVFRPGNRIYPAWRGYRQGEIVTVRVIEVPGCDAKGIPPIFNTVRLPIRIDDIRLIRIDMLTPEDFNGSSPDVYDSASLVEHLEWIYAKPLRRFSDSVTRIGFHYLREVRSGNSIELSSFPLERV